MYVNEIINAISVAISKKYPDFEVYTDKVEQGLKEPCFFIKNLKRTYGTFLSKRYKTTNLFSIQLIPDDSINANEVMASLFSLLEFITIENGDIFKATNMSMETTDEVLTLTLNYDFFMKESVKKDNLMNNYGVKTSGERD